MLRFGKKARLKAAVNDLRLCVGGAPLAFSGEVLDGYERLNDELQIESGEPQFQRIAMQADSPSSMSHISQMVLALEGVCLFTHYLNRLTFRPSSEALREVAYDPIVLAVAQLYSDLIAALPGDAAGSPSSEKILSYINSRDEQYAKAAHFVGDDPTDQTSVVGIAPRIISDMVHRPDNEALQVVIRACLLRQMALADWTEMVRKAEANL